MTYTEVDGTMNWYRTKYFTELCLAVLYQIIKMNIAQM